MRRYICFLLSGLLTSAYSYDLETLYRKYMETKDDTFYREFMKKVETVFGDKKTEKYRDKISYLGYLLEKYRETGDERYYTEFISFFHKNLELSEKKERFVYRGEDKELLKLILETFLATNDLENGYIASKIGKERFPEDIFFLKSYADISLWLGRYDDAVEGYSELYLLTGRDEYKDKALKLSLAFKKYDAALKILEDDIRKGDYTHWKEIVSIYEDLGEPEKAKDVLNTVYSLTRNREALKKLIYLDIETGDIRSAVERIERLDQISVSDAIEFSRVFYAVREYRKSLEILKKVIGKADFDNKEYWETLSDLAWGMKDYETGFFASSVLYYTRKARKIDYERMILYTLYRKRFKDLADVSYSGWLRYRQTQFYYYYLYALDNLKDYSRILISNRYLSPYELNTLKKKEFFWFYYIKAVLKKGDKKRAVEIYREALTYIPDSESLIAGYLWFLIELKDYKELKKALKKWKSISYSSSDLILVYASGYSLLQNSSKALPYIRRLYKNNKNNPEILSVYADILEISGKTEEAQHYRYRAWRLLKKKSRDLDSKGFRTYLYLSLYFEPAEKISYLLKKAEDILSHDEITEIRIIYHLMRRNYETAEYLLRRYRNPEPWMRLSIALNNYDLYRQKEITEKYTENLPVRDLVEALKNTGSIDLSESYAFENLRKNPEDNYLYRQLRDLVQEYEDLLSISTEYSIRRDISQLGVLNSLRLKIDNGYSLYAGFNYYNILNNSSEDIINLPSSFYSVYAGIGRKKSRYSYKLILSQIKKLKEFSGFLFEYKTYLKDRFSIKISAEKNQTGQETLYLYYGGMKDSIRSTIYYNLTSKISFDISAQLNRYRSQDSKNLGKGYIFSFEGFRKIRAGYPDYTVYTFIRKGNFSEKDKKGIIKSISVYENPLVLPESYLEAGAGFSFGLEHKNTYTGVWRPYFDTAFFLNSVTGTGFSFEAGAGGSLINQDHLSVGISFYKGVQGTTDSILRMNINYFLLF